MGATICCCVSSILKWREIIPFLQETNAAIPVTSVEKAAYHRGSEQDVFNPVFVWSSLNTRATALIFQQYAKYSKTLCLLPLYPIACNWISLSRADAARRITSRGTMQYGAKHQTEHITPYIGGVGGRGMGGVRVDQTVSEKVAA